MGPLTPTPHDDDHDGRTPIELATAVGVQHVALILTGAFILLTFIAVVGAAHGSLTSAVAIASNAPPFSVMAGVAVRLIPLFVGAVVALAVRAIWVTTKSILATVAALLCAFGIVWLLASWMGAIFGVLLVVSNELGRRAGRRSYRRSVETHVEDADAGTAAHAAADRRIRDLHIIAIFVTVLWVVLVLSFSMWLPAREYRLTDGTTIVGYEISDEGAETLVLEEQSRTVIVLTNDQIASAEMCIVSSESWLSAPLRSVMVDYRAPRYERCNSD